MTPAMRLRLMIASCLLATLPGCVRLGATDLLVTPVAIVAVHSFAPSAPRAPDALRAQAEPMLSANATR